jgi:hypothetical protein
MTLTRCLPGALLLVGALAGCASPGATGSGSASAHATASASAGHSELAGVPAGFPIMPGSTAVEPLPTEPGLLGRWTQPVNGSVVYRFFVDALPAAGFRVDQLLPGGAVAVIRFTTAGGDGLDLQLTAARDGTRIDLRQREAEEP